MAKQQTRFIKGVISADPICEACLALCAYREGVYYPSGTAIMVGPMLAMTARHVLEDYFEEYDNTNFNHEPIEITAGFTVMAMHHETGATWECNKFYFLHGRPDIVFIHLRYYNDLSKTVQVNTPIVDLNVPKEGEMIYAFGYIAPENDADKNNENRIQFGPTTDSIRIGAFSEGSIIKVHEMYRDTGRLNWPCFHTNARFDGGMSGGPIFNMKHKLIGLVCSNMPPSNDEEDHVSYGTLLYPSMIIPMAIPYAGFEGLTYFPAYNLFENIIKSEGREKYQLFLNQDNQRYETIAIIE